TPWARCKRPISPSSTARPSRPETQVWIAALIAHSVIGSSRRKTSALGCHALAPGGLVPAHAKNIAQPLPSHCRYLAIGIANVTRGYGRNEGIQMNPSEIYAIRTRLRDVNV